MMDQLTGVAAEYERGLAAYLKLRSENELSEAARLGRLAMSEKLGVLDMIMIHHAALAGLRPVEGQELQETLSSSALFLCEALSSFEMTHRGFQDASDTVMRMVQFALVICHELRTPLTAIVTSLGMLQEILEAGPDSNEGRLIANAMKSAAILKTRTDDLQDLASYRAGILSLKPGMVDVGALLTGVVGRMEPMAHHAEVEIHVDVAADLPKIRADPNRLEQIVSNLINNALKYAADGRRLDLRALTRQDWMVIEVRDYGQGIDPNARWKIFQSGPHKGDASRDVSSMGIGLALCRELAEQHGGRIVVATEEGKGSLFTVELPLGRRSVSHEGSDH